jgi:hypothetical protein
MHERRIVAMTCHEQMWHNDDDHAFEIDSVLTEVPLFRRLGKGGPARLVQHRRYLRDGESEQRENQS